MTAQEPTYRSVRPDEKRQCLDLWLTVWPGPDNEAYFRRYFEGDVEWLPYYTQVAELDGKLVSAVQICKRTVSCGPIDLTMGGIANVATLPEHTGKGYNTGCMKRAIAIMEADAMDFSMLFTGINGYYDRYGFCNIDRTVWSIPIPPGIEKSANTVTVRKAVRGDLHQIRQVYDLYNAAQPITVRRTEAYWRDWMRFDDAHPPETFTVAADPDGCIVGYLVTGVFSSAVPYSSAETEIRVVELGAAAKTEQENKVVIAALLQEAACRLSEVGASSLCLEVSLTSAVRAALDSICGLLEVCAHSSNSGMVRLLHRDNLMRSLCMVWNESWRAAGAPVGRISVTTPYGLVLVDATGPMICISTADDADVACSLTQSQFFGLLFGGYNAKQCIATAQETALIEAIFQNENMVFYGLDGF